MKIQSCKNIVLKEHLSSTIKKSKDCDLNDCNLEYDF